MRPTFRLTAALALLAAASDRAAAQTPCAADAARICPGLPAGDGRLWACLVRNQFSLQADCQRTVQEVQRRASEFNADCAADVYRFCPGTQPGGGRVIECLSHHVGRRELSTNCEEAVLAAIEKLQEYADACTDDAARLCPGVEAGQGKVVLCLRSQPERLSSRCRRAVSF